MKKITFIITGLFIVLQWGCRLEKLEVTTNCLTQGFEKKYTHNFPDPGNLAARDIVETTEGEYLICGTLVRDLSSIFLLKIDNNGNQIFLKQDIQTISENALAIAKTSDGGFLVGGEQGSNALFVKYGSNGERLGELVSSTPQSACNYITALGNDVFLFSSERRIPGLGTRQSHIGIIEMQGNQPEIIKEYAPPSPGYRQVSYAATPSGDGNYAVVGESDKNNDSSTQIYFFRLNQDMELIADSERYYTLGGGRNLARDIVKTNDNSYLLTGQIVSGGKNAFVARVDLNGDNIELIFNGSGIAEADGYGIISGNNEYPEYLIVGDTWESPNDANPRQVYVAKIDDTGSQIWEKDFGEFTSTERAFNIIRTTDCGYALVGFEGTPTSHAYVIKIDESGNAQ